MITDITIPSELSDVDKLIFLVRVSDKADQLTREGLYKVFSENSWQGRFASWTDFVKSPEGLNKSQGWASKHLDIYRTYTLEGGIPQERLIGIPTESLYIARTLNGTLEERVAKAETLTRDELKEEAVDGGHIHGEEIIQIYKCCGMRVPDHA